MTALSQDFTPVAVRGADANFMRYAPELRRPEVNLVTWRPHMPPELRAALDALDLDAVANKLKKVHYFWPTPVQRMKIRNAKSRVAFEKRLRKTCKIVFNKPDDVDLLTDYLAMRTQDYAEALKSPKAGVGLLIIEPEDEYWVRWHADPFNFRGTQTLKGKFGCLAWTGALPLREDPLSFWGHPRKKLAQISPEEFGIIKCRASGNPLLHATPGRHLENGKRLISIYST